MNKSFGRVNLNRPKIRKYPIILSSNRNRTASYYKKVLKQLIVCIIIVVLVILIKNINMTVTNKTVEWIRISLKQEVDIKKSAKQIIRYAKAIPQIPNKVVSVFNNYEGDQDIDLKFIVPINGKIISYYGESVDPILKTKTFQRGIDILVSENKEVVSVADGEVIEIGESNSLGKYIKVKHSQNVFSFYSHCSAITVLKGQKVKQGDSIAVIHVNTDDQSAYLHFELWKDGKVVDPVNYIPFNKSIL